MGGCVVCAHASHGKRRNGTVISAELMQIVFAFLHLIRDRYLESNMVDPASGTCVGEWDGGKEGNACVGEFSQPPRTLPSLHFAQC